MASTWSYMFLFSSSSPPSSPDVFEALKLNKNIYDQVEAIRPIGTMEDSSQYSSTYSSDISRQRDFSADLSEDSSGSGQAVLQEDTLRSVYHKGVSSPRDEDQETILASLCCTGCKTPDSRAVANCVSCASFLCTNCVIAHQLMIAFEGHTVTSLEQPQTEDLAVANLGQPQTRHMSENSYGLNQLIVEAKQKSCDLQATAKMVDFMSSRLYSQCEKATEEVNETYNFYLYARREEDRGHKGVGEGLQHQ